MAIQGYKAIRLGNCMTGWRATNDLDDLLLPDDEFIPVSDPNELRRILRERHPVPDPILKRVFKDYTFHYATYPAVVTDMPVTEMTLGSVQEFERVACLVDTYGPLWIARSYTEISKYHGDCYKQSRLMATSVLGSNGKFSRIEISVAAIKRRIATAKRQKIAQQKEAVNERIAAARREQEHKLNATQYALTRLYNDAKESLCERLNKQFKREGIAVRVYNASSFSELRATVIRFIAPDVHLKNVKFKKFILAWGDAPKEHRTRIATEKWMIDAFIFYRGCRPAGLSKPRKKKVQPVAQTTATS